jgi:hypothetical protein
MVIEVRARGTSLRPLGGRLFGWIKSIVDNFLKGLTKNMPASAFHESDPEGC